MAFLRTKGIVIKEAGYGEADKIITIFSKNRGRITAHVRGGRRPKSNLAAASQMLCYADFVLFSGKEMYSVNSCEVIEPFYEIRNDMVKLTYAAHFIDIVLEIIQENQQAPKLLQLFLNTLHMLAKTDRDPRLLAAIFELRSLTISGFAPYVASCMICGREQEKNYAFSFSRCGFICDRKNCRDEDPFALELSGGAAKAIQHIVYSRMKNLFGFALSDQVLDEVSRVSRRYLKERLERDFVKLDFLKSI